MSKKKAESSKTVLEPEMLSEVSGGGDLDAYVNGHAGALKSAYDRGYNSCKGSKAERNKAGHAARQAKWQEVWSRGYNQLNLRN